MDFKIVDTEINTLKMDKDTFLLETIERDPFLAKKAPRIIKSVTSNKKPSPRIKKRTTIQSPTNITWPKITYHGFVEGEGSSTKLALLKIDNRLKRIRLNEMLSDEIKLTAISSDSVLLIRGKSRKTVKRSK